MLADVVDVIRERLGQMPSQTQEFLNSAATQPHDRASLYSIAEHYYDGDQNIELTDRQKEYLEASGLTYNENFCEVIVDALADRLAITGFTTSAASNDADPLSEWLWDYVWDKNRMDARHRLTMHEAIKKGDAYLIVDWDAERGCPRLTFNRPDIIIPRYGDDGRMRWVAKVWDTDEPSPTNPKGAEIRRMNLYYPNRVEKWFKLSNDDGEGSTWVEHMDDGDTVWPTPWTKEDGSPRGIPVYHFANKPGSHMFGHSEIKGTIPQQDRLNKELADLATITDTLSFPQRYALGVETTENLKSVPGEIWSGPMGSEFGQFEAANVDGPLGSIEKTLLRIAARSRTPAHLIVLTPGGAPSGEALKTAESGLVSKARDRAREWGDVWADVMVMAISLAVDYEAKEPPPIEPSIVDDLTVSPQWTDPETRNEVEHLDALAKMKELGVSKRTILQRIPDVDAERELQQSEADALDAASAMASMFNRGGLPAPANPLATTPRPPYAPSKPT